MRLQFVQSGTCNLTQVCFNTTSQYLSTYHFILSTNTEHPMSKLTTYS